MRSKKSVFFLLFGICLILSMCLIAVGPVAYAEGEGEKGKLTFGKQDFPRYPKKKPTAEAVGLFFDFFFQFLRQLAELSGT